MAAMISWEIDTNGDRHARLPLIWMLMVNGNYRSGIRGIRANASAVGDGEDITAVVRINGDCDHPGSG